MSGRQTGPAPYLLVVVAAVFALSVVSGLVGLPFGEGASLTATGRPAAPHGAPTATRRATPLTAIEHETCCAQTARFLSVRWTSSEKVGGATLTLKPNPPFGCRATVEPSGLAGTLGCEGLLAGATEYVATLSLQTAAGTYPREHRFRTMGDRLEGVKWFTEFEDPTKDPLACAAASGRIVQAYTTVTDPMTAEQIALGRPFNRSRDPGLDPVAIATVQKRLDGRNNYHYYRSTSKEEATTAAVYWLLRSGKPVHVITLAGQHDPVLIGFDGTFGTFIDDPVNRVAGMVVLDPQRGDLDPRTQSRRPDKHRSPAFQTGALIDIGEWYRDEWWFGFAYASVVDGVNIDRSDGAYPLPHWSGTYTIIADDGDAEWPSDREGRVRIR